MTRLLPFLLWACVAFAQIQPDFSMAVPPEDIDSNNLISSPIMENQEKGEIYLINSSTLTVVSKADRRVAKTIPFLSDGASCISPDGRIATMHFIRGTFEVLVTVVDPADGITEKLVVSRNSSPFTFFYGGGGCAFSPADGLLYLSSNDQGNPLAPTPNELKIISVDTASSPMKVVKGWAIGENYVKYLTATKDGVYAVEQHTDKPSMLGRIDLDGKYQVINPSLKSGGRISVLSNGQLYIGGGLYAPDGALIRRIGGPSDPSWPTDDLWYGYTPNGMNIATGLKALDLAIPGQAYVGTISHRNALDGTDQVITYRASGYLDFYDKVVQPPMCYQLANAATWESGPDVPVAPNEWIAIKGAKLAAQATLPGPYTDPDKPFPTELGGVRVQMIWPGSNVIYLPMNYAGPTQINALTPDLPAGVKTTTTVEIKQADGSWLPLYDSHFFRNSASTDPGLFTDPNNNPWIVHLDGAIDVQPRPLETASLYANGLGAVTPPVPSGKPAPLSPLSAVDALVEVTVCGQPAKVLWAGLAPLSVGQYQINVLMPDVDCSGQPKPLIQISVPK